MAGVDVQVKGVSKAMGELRVLLNEELKGNVEDALHKTALAIERKAKRNAPVDTGRLRASITVEDVEHPLRRKIRAGNAKVRYAAAVEYGSKAHTPPIEPLKAWSKRVLGDEGAAYAIQETISKRGTSAQPFMGPAWESEKSEYVRRVRDALRGK